MTAATPGRRLGRYHLVEPLGGGPCGEVYRAKVVGVAGMERQLAVKRFHPQVIATPGVSARLSQAARTYGGLDHPRIARLAELGVAGGETFTAVEWVNGLDLARLMTMAEETGSPLPAGASLMLVSAAARAIGYAHGRGVSHLGLAPTNLIATGDGDLKVTDVGILACRLPVRPSSDGSLALRLPYLAPEQLIGEPVSAATDVFVLGVIAYELVSGERPFGGATALEVEQSVLSARPAPLELPRPVARVIDRCLARSPFERFPDARALADALDAALRLSPLAGGKREIGDRVASALEHIARINEQQLSGALSFAVPFAPGTHRGSAVTTLPLPPPSKGTSGAAPPLSRPRPARPVERDEPDDHLAVGDQTLPRFLPQWPPTEQVPTLKPPMPPPPVPSTSPPPPPPPPPPPRPAGSNPPPFEPRPAAPTSASVPPPTPAPAAPPVHAAPPPRSSRRLLVVMLVLLSAGLAGVGGFFIHRTVKGGGRTIESAAAPLDAAMVVAAAPDVDADAAAEVAVVPPPDDDDKLVIHSEPSGARVFLDGADQGKTPLTIDGAADRLNLALFLPGHDLHLAEIDGHGTHEVNLVPVTPPEGPGGIKVRCRADDRYYVYLDGKPTGQLCPTERLGVYKGEHQVEVYDLVSETRRQFTAKVKKTRVSVRVRVDY